MNQHLIRLSVALRLLSRATVLKYLVLLGFIGASACASPQVAALGDVQRLLDTKTVDVLALASRLEQGGLVSESRWRLVQRLARPWRGSQVERALTLLARHGYPVLGPATARLIARYEAPATLDGLSPSARRELGLLLARRLLRQGARARAARLLKVLPFDPRVGHLRGLLALAAGDRIAARRWFRRARRSGGALTPMLALDEARLALAAGKLAAARRLYRAIPAGSRWAWRARLELAWLELRAKRPQHVLAVLAGARRSALGRAPDVELLRALALFDLCHPAARTVARRARRAVSGAIKRGAIFLRRRADSRLYYIEATAALAGATSAAAEDRGDGGLPAAFQFALSTDASFRLVDGFVRQLQRERRILALPVAKGLRVHLGAQLERRLVQAQTLAGATVRRLLAQALAELRELRSRADELLVELDRRAEGKPSARQGRQQWPSKADSTLAREPWLDALEVRALRSRCKARSVPSPR
jgi:hypothetical protein